MSDITEPFIPESDRDRTAHSNVSRVEENTCEACVDLQQRDLKRRRSRNNTTIFTLILVLLFTVSPGLCVAISNESKEAYTNWAINNIVPLILLGLCVCWWVYSIVIDCCSSRHHAGCLSNEAIVCGGWFLLDFPDVIASVAANHLEKQLKQKDKELIQTQKQKDTITDAYVHDLHSARQDREYLASLLRQANLMKMDLGETKMDLGETKTELEETKHDVDETKKDGQVTFFQIDRYKTIHKHESWEVIAERHNVTPAFIKTRLAIVRYGLPFFTDKLKDNVFSIPVYDLDDKFQGTFTFRFQSE